MSLQILRPRQKDAKPGHHKKTTPPSKIEIPVMTNRFELLQNEVEMEDSDNGNVVTETTDHEKPNNSAESEQNPQTEEKIPPIVLRQKEKWLRLSQLIKEKRLSVTKAQTINDGIRINPATVNDFRSITKMLDHEKFKYHSYQLPSEKLLHVVIKGIPEPTPAEDVKEDLEFQGFHPDQVKKMYRRKDRRPLPAAKIIQRTTEAAPAGQSYQTKTKTARPQAQ